MAEVFSKMNKTKVANLFCENYGLFRQIMKKEFFG